MRTQCIGFDRMLAWGLCKKRRWDTNLLLNLLHPNIAHYYHQACEVVAPLWKVEEALSIVASGCETASAKETIYE